VTSLIRPGSTRIGLALSGGAARGIAHVGVLKALAEYQIPISCVAGTSAGSIVAAAFASGMPQAEIEQMGRGLRWRNLGRMTMSRLGVQINDRLENYLKERLPVTRFEDLPIPLAVVATDLKLGTAVVMRDEGDIPFAVRASCAIPGWYVPVTDS
jgi:NTE family protein